MRAARASLGLTGIAGLGWGLWLLSDDGLPQLVSVVLWVAGGVVLHDLLVGPLTMVVGALLARHVPAATQRAVASVLVVWATTSVAVASVLSGQGGKPDNPSLLTGDYRAWWVALTVAAALVVVALVVRGRRRQVPVHDLTGE